MNKKAIFFLLLAVIIVFSGILIFSIVEFAQVWCQDYISAQSEFTSEEFRIFAMKWFSINLIIIIFELCVLCGLIVTCIYVYNSELKDKEKRLAADMARKAKSKQNKKEKLLKQLEELEKN